MVPHSNRTAHSPIELSHFQADVACSYDREAFREDRTIEPVAGIQKLDFIQSRDFRNGGACSGIEHNLICRDFRISDAQCEAYATPSSEPRMAAQQFGIVRTLKALFQAMTGFEGHVAGTPNYGWEVSFYRWNFQTVFGCTPRIVGDLGRGDRSFGGGTAEVDTRATQVSAFGKRDLATFFRECPSQRNSCLAAADHDNIIGRRFPHTHSWKAARSAFTAAPMTAISELPGTISNTYPCSGLILTISRSEERRVGKECRY